MINCQYLFLAILAIATSPLVGKKPKKRAPKKRGGDYSKIQRAVEQPGPYQLMEAKIKKSVDCFLAELKSKSQTHHRWEKAVEEASKDSDKQRGLIDKQNNLIHEGCLLLKGANLDEETGDYPKQAYFDAYKRFAITGHFGSQQGERNAAAALCGSRELADHEEVTYRYNKLGVQQEAWQLKLKGDFYADESSPAFDLQKAISIYADALLPNEHPMSHEEYVQVWQRLDAIAETHDDAAVKVHALAAKNPESLTREQALSFLKNPASGAHWERVGLLCASSLIGKDPGELVARARGCAQNGDGIAAAAWFSLIKDSIGLTEKQQSEYAKLCAKHSIDAEKQLDGLTAELLLDKQWDHLLAILQTLQLGGFDVKERFMDVANTLCKANDIERARRIMAVVGECRDNELAKKAELLRDDIPDCRVIEARRLVEQSQVEEAKALLRAFPIKDLRMSDQMRIALLYSEIGMLTEGWEVLRRGRSDGNALAYWTSTHLEKDPIKQLEYIVEGVALDRHRSWWPEYERCAKVLGLPCDDDAARDLLSPNYELDQYRVSVAWHYMKRNRYQEAREVLNRVEYVKLDHVDLLLQVAFMYSDCSCAAMAKEVLDSINCDSLDTAATLRYLKCMHDAGFCTPHSRKLLKKLQDEQVAEAYMCEGHLYLEPPKRSRIGRDLVKAIELFVKAFGCPDYSSSAESVLKFFEKQKREALEKLDELSGREFISPEEKAYLRDRCQGIIYCALTDTLPEEGWLIIHEFMLKAQNVQIVDGNGAQLWLERAMREYPDSPRLKVRYVEHMLHHVLTNRSGAEEYQKLLDIIEPAAEKLQDSGTAEQLAAAMAYKASCLLALGRVAEAEQVACGDYKYNDSCKFNLGQRFFKFLLDEAKCNSANEGDLLSQTNTLIRSKSYINVIDRFYGETISNLRGGIPEEMRLDMYSVMWRIAINRHEYPKAAYWVLQGCQAADKSSIALLSALASSDTCGLFDKGSIEPLCVAIRERLDGAVKLNSVSKDHAKLLSTLFKALPSQA